VNDPNNEFNKEKSLQLATSALLVEMMRADDEISKEEKEKISDIIQKNFTLSPEETDMLLQMAETEVQNATDYYQFTTLIKTGFSYEQKVRIIERLWEVAYADARLHRYEEHLVRKIAGLIQVSHQDFISTKLKVRDALI
jgi:uncharacterized tellurite resistance protein B-like protein